MAAPLAGNDPEHAPQSGLRWDLRLRAQFLRPAQAAAGTALQRKEAGRDRGVAGVPARGPAFVYHRGAARAAYAADGRETVPHPEHGRGALQPGPAPRAPPPTAAPSTHAPAPPT